MVSDPGWRISVPPGNTAYGAEEAGILLLVGCLEEEIAALGWEKLVGCVWTLLLVLVRSVVP